MSKYIYLLKLILLECVIPVGIVNNLHLTRRMPLVEQELLTLSEHLSPSIIITGFITRVTGWIPQVVHELPTLPKHQSSLPGFSEVVITTMTVPTCTCGCDSFNTYPFHIYHPHIRQYNYT